MVKIHSKDIYYITKDVLKNIEPKVMNHGTRTAYILSQMLLCMEKYEMYEVAEFAYMATLHDIGAYSTDDLSDSLSYETKNVMPHSIYGYLFFLDLTPFSDRAKIILYHHTDFDKIPRQDFDFSEVAECLNLAEKIDIYSTALGEKIDVNMFEKHVGTKYSQKAIDLYRKAERKNNILEKLSNGKYVAELDDLLDYLIFTDAEKDQLLFGLSFLAGLKSEYALLDVALCVSVAMELGERMNLMPTERDNLYYASLLHDIGMCVVPGEIFEKPRKLTDEEKEKVHAHLEKASEILGGKVIPEVMDIISTHHEREDGSGYPSKLRGHQMNRAQKILQVADVIATVANPRAAMLPKSDEEIIAILKEEADKGHLNEDTVRIATLFYDDIMKEARIKSEERLRMYEKMKSSYKQACRQ